MNSRDPVQLEPQDTATADAHAGAGHTPLPIAPGKPWPLGVHWDGDGVNFAVFSSSAHRIEVSLFDEAGTETARVTLPQVTDLVFHGRIAGIGPGQRYGLRADGPWQPENGLQFNPNKLLLDPYARAIDGPILGNSGQYAYDLDAEGEDKDLVMCPRDNAADMPKCIVVDETFDWEGDQPPATSWRSTVFYEVHVKGLTQQHPGIAEDLRGTYAGLAQPPVIEHLQRIGVTAVELLPVQAFIDDQRLVEAGLTNYWGYNTVGFFAPEPRYAQGGNYAGAVREFKTMVRALHKAGLEVILDVVYNHTGEGNHLGPTLCLKGLDNEAYYRLTPDDRRFYMDFTGCGNTISSNSPAALRLVVDSLRYWVTEMHVDGFRFDLAAALGRGEVEFDRYSSFFAILLQDPVLSRVKLIAEPWDIGSYQVGAFPTGWGEWNGKFRDVVRDFWRGEPGTLPELAQRLAGSADSFWHSGRKPTASINLVTVHDGFTLRDLVSYNEKHNEANQEDSRDGESHNRSWNCGAEGETDDAEIRELRARQVRNLLATLFVSQGVPLLLGGDELGRTQGGNNNGYCQDSPISWYDWHEADTHQGLIHFVQRLTALRRAQPTLRRANFFYGIADDSGTKDLAWYTPEGLEMGEDDWADGERRTFSAVLHGLHADPCDGQIEREAGDSVLLVFNAAAEPMDLILPGEGHWEMALDTRSEDGAPQGEQELHGGRAISIAARSMLVMTQPAA